MIIDLHVHTPVGEAGLLRFPYLRDYIVRSRFVERARQIGLDAVCLTEHDAMWPAEILEELSREFDFLFLRGMEVSTNYADYGHVLAYGIDSYISGIWDVGKLCEVADEAKGVLVVAHPFRELLPPPETHPNGAITLGKACQMPIFRLVDAVEVYNGNTRDRENEFAVKVWERLGLKATGGSDAHSVTGLGKCFTIFERQIRNQNEFLEELRAGRFKPSLAPSDF